MTMVLEIKTKYIGNSIITHYSTLIEDNSIKTKSFARHENKI